MYIEAVPNRNSPPAILLRESYRDEGKGQEADLCNLTDWPPHLIEGLRALLKGGGVLPPGQDALTIRRSLPHGHVAAVLGTVRTIGLDRLLGPAGNRCRDLALAMIVSRLIAPASKLATARALDPATAAHPVWATCWAWARSTRTNSTPRSTGSPSASRRSRRRWPGAISRTARWCSTTSRRAISRDAAASWRRFGYNRDGKKGKLQIVYGLLCAADGCPVAIEVFDGSTADPKTLATQIDKLKQRFGLTHVVLVGDRGMITQARIGDDLKPAGLDWITALAGAVDPGAGRRRRPAALAVRRARHGGDHLARLSGERLIVCRNPDLARERGRKREDLLAATEKALAAIQRAVEPRHQPLRGDDRDRPEGRRRARHSHKMAKHFDSDHRRRPLHLRPQDRARSPPRRRSTASMSIRTSLPADQPSTTPHASRAYKSLALVERAFRSLKTVDLQIRPIYHWLGTARARPCLPVHARLSRRMAHARQPGADALR